MQRVFSSREDTSRKGTLEVGIGKFVYYAGEKSVNFGGEEECTGFRTTKIAQQHITLVAEIVPNKWCVTGLVFYFCFWFSGLSLQLLLR